MNDQIENITRTLSDAGCGRDAIEQAERLLAAGRTEDLIRLLRLCRCSLMDDLHAAQKKVDRMDRLIRLAGREAAAK